MAGQDHIDFVYDVFEDQKRRAQESLERLLLAGLNSGEPIAADENFWADLKADALQMIEARKKTKAKRK